MATCIQDYFHDGKVYLKKDVSHSDMKGCNSAIKPASKQDGRPAVMQESQYEIRKAIKKE
jgi:hypothetical protein